MAKVANKLSALEQRIPLACTDEGEAVRFLEEQRGWVVDADAFCPKCGVHGEARRMKSKTGERNTRFLWRCGACKAQFTVKNGTIMEDSAIPHRIWCLAFFRAAVEQDLRGREAALQAPPRQAGWQPQDGPRPRLR